MRDLHDEHDIGDLMRDAAARAIRYLDGLDERSVAPDSKAVARLAELEIPLPEEPTDPVAILAELDSHAAATMAMSSAPSSAAT